jgi:hypothetical protein
MDHVLTVVDVTGIQPYIFGSNRLRENIGASELVEQATTDWVYQTLHDLDRTNIQSGTQAKYRRVDTLQMESHALVAELLYAGGGNAAIIFRNKDVARSWATAFSRKLLLDSAGLNVVIVHSKEFDWQPQGRDLPALLDDLLGKQAAFAKQNATPSAPLLGLGVTATCQSTGLVATAIDALDQRRISREIAAKLHDDVRTSADRRLGTLLPDYFDKLGLDLPRDFDDLGRS